MQRPTLSAEVFRKFAILIQENSGIQLAENREVMLRNRIAKRMDQQGLIEFDAYYQSILDDASGVELGTLVESVTTNYTSFFRDVKHFEILEEFLVDRLSGSRRKVRVWSSACSTGEEPYSIAMTVNEVATRISEPALRVRILATDIASKVLHATHAGLYSKAAVENLEPRFRKYFEADVSENASKSMRYRVKDAMRRQVTLRRFNLCDRSWKVPEDIDVIFCRNVLIYFDEPTQNKILKNLAKHLSPSGLLFVGSSESVRNSIPELEPIAPAVFRKPHTEDQARIAHSADLELVK